MFQKMCKITQHNDNYVVVNIINILFAYLLLIGNKNLFIITKVVDKKKGLLINLYKKRFINRILSNFNPCYTFLFTTYATDFGKISTASLRSFP